MLIVCCGLLVVRKLGFPLWSRKPLDVGQEQLSNGDVEEVSRDNLQLRIEKSLSLLRGQIERLDMKYKELIHRSKLYFERCIEALVSNDEERAKIYASEIAELRKLANAIMHSNLILLQVRIRLESILELGDVLALVKPLTTLLENVREEVAGIVPEAADNLRTLAYVIEDFITTSENKLDMQETNYEANVLSDEALKVLREAKQIAAEKVKEQFPDIPKLTEEEKTVLSYINQNPTESLDLTELSTKTGINHKELEKILQKLHEKGMIELEIETS
ncbi:MAG TPA: hypothetical protein EYH45_02725 [Candidatus Caldiarchaeum subterraneum]|uniref:Uncharacterized protein n=1 Tax=Caldiarchaeum subterraneum TaxID=311458 RepID=A0A833EA77_CALS0|nr:hypothetical protein [Candidatus Caldarchaeum subterraneum]